MISQPLPRNGENGANGLPAPHLADLAPNSGHAHAVNQLLREKSSALGIPLSLKIVYYLSVQVNLNI